MRFKKLRTFREDYFEDPKPDMRTLMKWPEVRKRGGQYYIDLDLLEPAKASSNSLLDRILRDAADESAAA